MFSGVLILVLLLLIPIAAAGLWVWALVDVVRLPDHQFRSAGTDQASWILIVALTNVVGAAIWLLSKRAQVRAAGAFAPPPPPGWYPAADGGVRWWDGIRWGPATGDRP